jgi:hypothetical protein
MTKQEQKEFVKTCLDSLEVHFNKLHDQGKIPITWDGIELRWFINDMAKTLNWSKTSNHRKQEYNNHIFTNNLI